MKLPKLTDKLLAEHTRPERVWTNEGEQAGGYDVVIVDDGGPTGLHVQVTFKSTRHSEPEVLLDLPPTIADFIGKALKYKGQVATQFELKRQHRQVGNPRKGIDD